MRRHIVLCVTDESGQTARKGLKTMNDIDELIANAIVELTELAHDELMETDEEYAEKRHLLSERSNILKIAEESLSAEEAEQLKAFRELESELNARHIQQSYIKGAKDCVALLKKLGII